MTLPVITDAAPSTLWRTQVRPAFVVYWNTRQGEPVRTKKVHEPAVVLRKAAASVPFAADMKPLAVRYTAGETDVSSPPKPSGAVQFTPSLVDVR
jgi:hypothetical protein